MNDRTGPHAPRPLTTMAAALLLSFPSIGSAAGTVRAETLLASVEAGMGLRDPSLAVGLSPFAYFLSPPFLNLMHQGSRGATRDGDGERISWVDMVGMGLIDPNGYPTALPPGNVDLPKKGQRGYSYGISLHHVNDAVRVETSGEYVVTWAGEGLVDLRGFQVSEREMIRDADGTVIGGRLVGGWPYGQKVKSLTILETDPRGVGNHVRDISVVRAEYADLYQAGALFDPRYLATVTDYRALRFMDWMGTNGSDVVVPADVMPIGYASWREEANVTNPPDISEGRQLETPGHLPFEVMIRLANEVGADPWFNIPLKADDAYVSELARRVDADLDADLVATFELSNEVWNFAGAFRQTREASLLGTEGQKNNDLRAARGHYGHRSAEIRALLEREMDPGRFEMSLAAQTSRPDIAEWTEAGVERYFEEQGQNGSMSDVFDVLAVTGYFSGVEREEMDDLRAHWRAVSQARFEAGETTAKHAHFVERAAAYLLGGLDVLSPEELARVARREDGSIHPRLTDPIEGFLSGNFASHAALAEAWGLELVQYEGDSHITPKKRRDDPEAEWFKALNRSPEMAGILTRAMTLFREAGGVLVNDFEHLGDSESGLFGTRTHLADENPILAAYDTYNATAAAVFGSINTERAPEAFLHGVTEFGTADGEILTGTAKRDYLLGRGGDDILVAGGAADGLHGGDGIDVALFAASKDAVEIRVEDGRLIVAGPEGENRLVAVEILAFAGSGTLVDARRWTGADPDMPFEEMLASFTQEGVDLERLFETR